MPTSDKRKPKPTAVQCFEDIQRQSTGHSVSLHTIWRSVGSPPDRSPAFWLSRAEGLIDGMVSYQHSLASHYIGDQKDEDGFEVIGNYLEYPEDMTFTSTPERIQAGKENGFGRPDHLERAGDTMAEPEIAWLYARFVDRVGLAWFGPPEEDAAPKKRGRLLEPGESPILKMTPSVD